MHYAVFCSSNVNINTLPACMVSEKSGFPKKTCFDVSRFILCCIFTSNPSPTALSDMYRLFTTIVYLAIQVACFGAIFDCITNMTRFFICTLSSRRQITKHGLIFILTLTSHFTFLYVFIL